MLRLQEMRGIVGAQMGGRGSIMNIEKLTTSLQFIGAALALPAGAAGVYSAYHTYFSPEVMCQEMRNATLITLEKNIPAEAKRTLLRKEASQFEASAVKWSPNPTPYSRSPCKNWIGRRRHAPRLVRPGPYLPRGLRPHRAARPRRARLGLWEPPPRWRTSDRWLPRREVHR